MSDAWERVQLASVAGALPAEDRRRVGGAVRCARLPGQRGRLRRAVDPRQLPLHRRRASLHHGHRRRRHRAGDRDGAPRGPGSDLPQLGGVRRGRVLRLVLPRHSAHRADVPALPGPPAGRSQPCRALRVAARGLRPGARPGCRGRRHHRAGPQLRRLHDRDLPRGHPVGCRRPGRGRRRARHDLRPEDAQGGAAAGVPSHHPAHGQRVHRDDEGHRAGLLPRGDRRERGDLPPLPAGRQGRLQEPRGVRRRRARLLGRSPCSSPSSRPGSSAGSAGATTGSTSPAPCRPS